MGSAQSQEEPDVVRIDRSEIPEEYKLVHLLKYCVFIRTVGVSSDVVRRVSSQSGNDSNNEAVKLRDELDRERQEKLRLKEEMIRLSELQQRKLSVCDLLIFNMSMGLGSHISILRHFRDELDRERQEKLRLKEEMIRLSELQQRKLKESQTPLLPDVEERKRIFDETVERIENKFFPYHRENICVSHEKEIMSCLSANPGRILECAPLAEIYEKCVSDFRQEVLKGK
ncbi:hypothetical protein DICVIV_09557 [Dictyocaulus viviparus]|uniref:Uncharacterized protein n=1 Tax=Dictyocaulus viviparus TaxID=29172 RepID=A0A0D8XIK3_DICVI|nr:hypothetical protein DICVIV_09557 [Dictyocaulus viviparus]